MTVSWTQEQAPPPDVDLGEDDGDGDAPTFGVIAVINSPEGESCGARVEVLADGATPGMLARALQAASTGAAHAYNREVGDQFDMRQQDPDQPGSTHHPAGGPALGARLTVAVLDDLARQYVANTPGANLDNWTLSINGMIVSFRATRHVLAAAQAWQ